MAASWSPQWCGSVATNQMCLSWGNDPSHFPEARGPIGEMIRSVTLESQGIPLADRVAPRRTDPGTLDLTASTIFVGAVERHALIVKFARGLNQTIPFDNAQINLGVAMEMFLKTLHALHRFWRQKSPLTPADLERSGLDWV